MKTLIVDTYYPPFLKSYVGSHSELAHAGYRDMHAALMATHFAEADSYSHYLRPLGHEAVEVIANAGFLQRRWARERGLKAPREDDILVEQIKAERPDVLYLQNLGLLDDGQLKRLRPFVRMIAGQVASPLPLGRDLSGFDLILSSFPHFVRFFRNVGIASEYLRLGFDPRILREPSVSSVVPTTSIAFVGGLSPIHQEGTRLLEAVARDLPLEIWGYGVETLPSGSPLRSVHRGSAWALDMYRVLAGARISLNRHVDVAGPFANNLRLYEATGVGTCLVTDHRDNLAELFEPDREVVAYRSPEECVEKCRYLLDHEAERRAIAEAGQKRTLHEHTYAHRMAELADILGRHLAHSEHGSRRLVHVGQPGRGLLNSPTVRDLARRLPGRRHLKALYWRLPSSGISERDVSAGHRVIAPEQVTARLAGGWQSEEIPARQRRLVDAQLLEMYQGHVPLVFRAAADAVRATGMDDGSLVEIGCASGYYFEVLGHLLRHRVDYRGIDYSLPLIEQARRCYPEVAFAVGDAARLPMADLSCDILFSGTVLLHVPDYAAVIRESARVARHWCILHRTPVSPSGDTTYLSKRAYGVNVVELVFGEEELFRLFSQCRLKVERAIEIDSYPLEGVRDKVHMLTYVCRKQ